MSTGSPDAPSSPRESEGSEKIPSGSDGGTEGENIPQEVQLTYKDEFANEVLVFTSLDDFHEGIKMNRVTETEEGTTGGDLFECVVQFPPGRHLYRYLVDGEWMCDEIKEVTYLQGNAYNEIEVEQPSALMSKSALKRKEKRKRWRQKKKIAKQRRRALEIIGDGKTDPKTQNKQMAETLKSIESSTQQKLNQAEETFAKEKEQIKTKQRQERDNWMQKVEAEKGETAKVQKELAQFKLDFAALKEQAQAATLESQQSTRRAQELEKQQTVWDGEKAALEKKERETVDENQKLNRKMKTLRGELQAKFEKQIEEVTAAMEAELRNTSVNIFYLKKEIEKHKLAEEQATEQVKTLTLSMESTKKEKDELELRAASTQSELKELTHKFEHSKSEGGQTGKELETVKEQLDKLNQKHKAESASYLQKVEEFKRLESTLSSEKQSFSEAEAKAKEELKKLRDQNYQLQTDLTTNQAKSETEIAELRAKLQAEVEGTKAELGLEQKKNGNPSPRQSIGTSKCFESFGRIKKRTRSID